jgi:hypothetical protein
MLAQLKLSLATEDAEVEDGEDLRVTLHDPEIALGELEELLSSGINRVLRDLMACRIRIGHELIPIIAEVTIMDTDLCLTFPWQIARCLFGRDRDISPAGGYVTEAAKHLATRGAHKQQMH